VGRPIGAPHDRLHPRTLPLRQVVRKTVAVTVRADKKFEFDEMFYLNLSGAAGAFVMDSQGVGVVRNDDR
jgi:hypothetical protein